MPDHLLHLIRGNAHAYFQGFVSSADAFARIDRAILHPLNGTAHLLNDAHAEFDASVNRLIDRQNRH